jgi:hypothetical protein
MPDEVSKKAIGRRIGKRNRLGDFAKHKPSKKKGVKGVISQSEVDRGKEEK